MVPQRPIRAALALIALLPAVAAGDVSLRFDWHAPDACPQRDAVLGRAAELLGRSPESALAAPLELRGVVSQPSDGGWQLDLSQRASSGEPTVRSVSAASCSELADAAALFLALAIDPALNAGQAAPASTMFQPEPEPAPAVAETPAAAQPTAPPAAPPALAVAIAPPASDPVSPPLRVGVGAAFAIWSRRLPGAAPGVLATASVARGAWWGLLNLGFFPARHASVAGSTAGGELALISVGPELGYAFVWSGFEASPLLDLDLEWLRGSGSGIAHPADADLLLLGVGGGVRVALRPSPSWALVGHGMLSVLAARPRFVLEGIGPVYRPPSWGLRLGLGAEWRP